MVEEYINRLSLGRLAIILGCLVLSMELFGLKIIQGLDMAKGSWHTNPFSYAEEVPVALALWITVAIIVYGSWIVFVELKKQKNITDK